MNHNHFFLIIFIFINQIVFASPSVNVYVWGGEIPKSVLQQFEHETGISVNFSTYDSNETMFAKLKASRKNVYDVILPSAYYVERMLKQDMLTRLDSEQLPNLKNLDALFLDNEYDKGNQYSVPFIWGATGIFYNQQWVTIAPSRWNDLWDSHWKNKLLLLDDPRELFSSALISLGYQPNDPNPSHIQQAYEKLLRLVPNVKIFASDSVQAIVIDEDAILGSVWNGDAFKAHAENSNIQFIYPQEGYMIWVDCFAIPKDAPHLKEAYQFINFMLKPEIAAQVALIEGHAITNAAGKELLPADIRNNKTVYPTGETLKRGYFQRDVSDDIISLYNQYWEQLKLAF